MERIRNDKVGEISKTVRERRLKLYGHEFGICGEISDEYGSGPRKGGGPRSRRIDGQVNVYFEGEKIIA